jgi:hypothetical protein
VATLVAQDAAPGEVFAIVAEEVARLLEVDDVLIDRFEPEGTVTVVGAWGDVADFTGLPLGGRNVVSEVHPTGRPARLDDSDRFGDGMREPEAQARIQVAINRGFQTRDGELALGTCWATDDRRRSER